MVKYRPKRDTALPRSVLRERANVGVTIESYTLAQDVAGEEVKTWATLLTRRGLLLPLSGSQQAERAASHTLSIRFASGLTRDMRLVIDTVAYEVHDVIDVDNDGREHVCRIRPTEAN